MIDHAPGYRREALSLAALGLFLLLALAATTHAAPPVPVQSPVQSFNIDSAAPRPVEETTALAVQRDYSQAWQSLVAALEENRAEMLDENFTGGARQQWQDAIRAQRKNGLSRRIVDHGHQVRVRFYSLDGSALEAIDTADLEIQYREGSKLLSSERVQTHYLVLLTPAENSWKIRILQELPPS